MHALSQFLKVVVLFLLQSVWFDCREWTHKFLSVSKNYGHEIDETDHFAQMPFNDSFPITCMNF